MMRKPPSWQQYQDSAAAHYRELGLSAETDVTLIGARGTHAVDVVVRGHRAGIGFLWIVECKWWDRPVPKSTVLTLSSVMLDVGADRGILLSRNGFQSGAAAMAEQSNITLTSLEEVIADTATEHTEYRCDRLRRRCEDVLAVIHTSGLDRLRDRGGDPFEWPDIELGARAGALQSAITEGRGGRWPVGITRRRDGRETHAFIENMSDLLAVVDHMLGEIEDDLHTAMSRLDG